MPQIKLDLPIEVLNEWARLANERKEPVRVTLSNFVSQEAHKLTLRAPDIAYCTCKNPIPAHKNSVLICRVV